MSRPPLHALQAFVAIARTRNLTRAATQLNLTVSALSHQMRALEERMNQRLLLRGPRGVTLTPQGERLLENIAPHVDGILSVDAAGIYKPAPAVYQLAVDQLRLAPEEIAFVSSNGWDAAGAKVFGFTTFWINRYGVPVERHAPEPDFIVGSLALVAGLA